MDYRDLNDCSKKMHTRCQMLEICLIGWEGIQYFLNWIDPCEFGYYEIEFLG